MELEQPASLARFHLFSEFAPRELEAVAGIVRIVEASKGEILFREGERCRGFYLVHSGKVRVYRIGEGGKTQTIHLVSSGGSFAEVSVFLNSGYPAFAEALEDAILYFVPRDAFLRLVADDATMCLKLLRGMAGWIRRLLALVENLSVESAESRVGRYLLSLAGEKKGVSVIRLPARKHIVANHIGITPETFSRALHNLREQGAIDVQPRGAIRIKDRSALDRS